MKRSRLCSLLLVIALLFVNSFTVQASETSFSDIPADSGVVNYVRVATQSGIMRGSAKNKFDPNKNLTCDN